MAEKVTFNPHITSGKSLTPEKNLQHHLDADGKHYLEIAQIHLGLRPRMRFELQTRHPTPLLLDLAQITLDRLVAAPVIL